MIKSPNYNEKRRKLARVCADALGLKDVPLELMELAVRRSDIPEDVYDDGTAVAQTESSLLSMGVVYSIAGITKFIARDGHTYILPYNDIVVGELEKCGYVICKLGSTAPYDKAIESAFDFDKIDFMESFSKKEAEKEYREKATLPSELVSQVMRLEEYDLPDCNIQQNADGEYTYDVFSDGLNGCEDYSLHTLLRTVDFYGYDNDVSRKLQAITGAGSSTLSDPDCTVTDLASYIDYAMQNEFMNSELYYAEHGPYNALMTSQENRASK